MHEASLAQSLVDIVVRHAQQAGSSNVKTVHVDVGALAQVLPAALETAFFAASRGTLAQDAVLKMHTVPGHAWCMACSQTSEVADRLAGCPLCGSGQLMVTGGDVLKVRELEVD